MTIFNTIDEVIGGAIYNSCAGWDGLAKKRFLLPDGEDNFPKMEKHFYSLHVKKQCQFVRDLCDEVINGDCDD